MKNNTDILSHEEANNKDIKIFKDGHGINEIQRLLEQNGYPFVKQRSLRTLIDRLRKTEKTLKKSKRNEIRFKNSTTANLLHQRQLNKNISNSVHYVRSSNQGTRPFTEK